MVYGNVTKHESPTNRFATRDLPRSSTGGASAKPNLFGMTDAPEVKAKVSPGRKSMPKKPTVGRLGSR